MLIGLSAGNEPPDVPAPVLGGFVIARKSDEAFGRIEQEDS